jgi:hypothetical protein
VPVLEQDLQEKKGEIINLEKSLKELNLKYNEEVAKNKK